MPGTLISADSGMDWRLHWLEAEGDLSLWRGQIRAEVEAAWAAMAGKVNTPPLDILVQRLPGAVIPEIGMVGHAYRKGLFALTLDPDNPRFAASLGEGALRRQVAHEAHHCLRMAGPGYGRTLGEALVSEGLAGQFTGWLFGNSPEPWECAVDDDTMRSHRPDATELADTNYSHNAWFYGTGGRRPRWLGYTLGYRLVGKWLAGAGTVDGETWVNVPAETVLAASGAPGAGKPVIRFHGTPARQDD